MFRLQRARQIGNRLEEIGSGPCKRARGHPINAFTSRKQTQPPPSGTHEMFRKVVAACMPLGQCHPRNGASGSSMWAFASDHKLCQSPQSTHMHPYFSRFISVQLPPCNVWRPLGRRASCLTAGSAACRRTNAASGYPGPGACRCWAGASSPRKPGRRCRWCGQPRGMCRHPRPRGRMCPLSAPPARNLASWVRRGPHSLQRAAP